MIAARPSLGEVRPSKRRRVLDGSALQDARELRGECVESVEPGIEDVVHGSVAYQIAWVVVLPRERVRYPESFRVRDRGRESDYLRL